MIFHHTGSKDTYITNKIVGGVRRATNANVGYASTIDLFKLYGESTLKGTPGICSNSSYTTEVECLANGGTWNTNLTELSRGLIEFDLDQLKSEITNDVAFATDASFKIFLKLYDIQGTQVAPSNFTLQLWGLAQPWDEGIGDNVSTFGDVAASNWLSRSIGTLWTTAGGHIDTSWNAADDTDSADLRTTIATQTFADGAEHLEMDVTDWVKAYWSTGNTTVTNNYGWILKYSSEETDSKSYFVKRFASRHTRNPAIRPYLEVRWSNYHVDQRLDFEAEKSNKISIRNFSNGAPAALSGTPTLTLSYTPTQSSFGDAWSATDASIAQVSLAGKTITGMYEATIPAIQPYTTPDASLRTDLVASGSILIQEKWTVENNSIPQIIHSGSFYLKNPLSNASAETRNYRISVVDLKSKYNPQDKPQVRLFVRDRAIHAEPVRIPIELPSQIINRAYFQIKDTNSMDVLIPFSDIITSPDESTRISTDAKGMYFSFPVSVLPRGKTYTIDIAYYDRGKRFVFESNQAFKVT